MIRVDKVQYTNKLWKESVNSSSETGIRSSDVHGQANNGKDSAGQAATNKPEHLCSSQEGSPDKLPGTTRKEATQGDNAEPVDALTNPRETF